MLSRNHKIAPPPHHNPHTPTHTPSTTTGYLRAMLGKYPVV